MSLCVELGQFAVQQRLAHVVNKLYFNTKNKIKKKKIPLCAETTMVRGRVMCRGVHCGALGGGQDLGASWVSIDR